MTNKTLFNTLNKTLNNSTYITYLDLSLKTFMEEKMIEELGGDEAVEWLLTYLLNTYKTLHILSEETGEILYTINLEKNTEDIIPEFREDIIIYGGEERDDGPSPYSLDVEEWKDAIEYEFCGFFYTMDGQTYMKDGIMLHKPPMDGIWSKEKRLSAEFRERDGVVTDRFYGSCNDFMDWFNAKAYRKERFNVYILGEGRLQRVARVQTHIGPYNTNEEWQNPFIEQEVTGEWKMVG